MPRTSTGPSRCCGSRGFSRSASGARRRSSATPAPRRTRPRSRSRARRPGERGSSRSRAAFTGARSARCRRPGSPRNGKASARCVPGVAFARPNDIESLEAALAPAGDTALMLLEPVLGEGGVIPLEPEFAQAASELALEVGALLCVDEIQTGMGRTGTFFAHEQLGIRPDLVTLAKGLANGLPMGALLAGSAPRPASSRATTARRSAATPSSPRRPSPSSRRSTTRCSPTCASAARSSRRAGGAARRARSGGAGCCSAPLDRPVGPVVDACRERGLLVLSAGPDVLRLTPPLVVGAAEVGRGARDDRERARRMNRRERQAAILRPRAGPGAVDPGRARPGAPGRGHDVVQTTVSRDVTELGLVKVRAPSGRLDLRRPGHGRRRPAARDRRRDAPVRDRGRGGRRRPRGRDDAVRLRERARAGDRRGRAPGDRGHACGRQHDLHRGEGRDDGALASCRPSSRAYLADGVDGMTLWSGRVGGVARSGRLGVSARRRRRAAPVRLRGERSSTRNGCTRPGCSATTSSPRRRRGWPRSRTNPAAISPRTRMCTARSSASSASSAARSTRAARGTTRSPLRSGSTSLDACAEARDGDRCARARRALVRGGRGRHADARVHAPAARRSRSRSATTCWPGWRCSTATAPASLRRRRGGAEARSARVRSPARRSNCPPPPGQMRNSIDAVADRDFALDYLYAVAVLYTHLSRIGEEIVLWSSRRVRLRPAAGERRDGVVDDAAEAEPGRGRARSRQGGHGDRPAGRPARNREGAAARVRPRPAGGQGAGLRGPARVAARPAGR